jgi:GT2 family glycosyltransferase
MSTQSNPAPIIGFVIIGRNEGERLKVCLKALPRDATIVYVDSGSTDDSVTFARSIGVTAITLDSKQGFTAARARNAGFKQLLAVNAAIEFIQFIDGDCELVKGWLEHAVDDISKDASVAIVCGRRHERYPKASIYNTLIDLEWDSSIGIGTFCGGDALIRRIAIEQVNGYREDLIAGEEPELCLRLANAGWSYRRIDSDMTLHDAAIYKLRQWWNRTRRSGFAFAQGAHLHGGAPHHHWEKETRSALFWAIALPISTAALVALLGAVGFLFLSVYLLQVIRMSNRSTHSWEIRILRSTFILLGKFPEALGVLQFAWTRYTRSSATLIEYK